MLEPCVSIRKRNLFIILSGFHAKSSLAGRIARPPRDASAIDRGPCPTLRWDTKRKCVIAYAGPR